MTRIRADEEDEAPRLGCLRYFGRLALRIVIVLAGALVITTLWQLIGSFVENRAYPPPGKLVDLGNYRLHLNCTGTGSPTVILESGAAGPSLMWLQVQPELAQTHRVCSYDRGGLGWSDPSPHPRTARAMADELHALLSAAEEPGPYLLVGHSLGGLVVRVFRDAYPGEVAGLVLVNAAHEDFNSRLSPGCQAISQSNTSFASLMRPLTFLGITRVLNITGALASFTQEIIAGLTVDQKKEMMALTFYRPAYWSTFDAELSLQITSEGQAKQTASLGALPLMVISGNPDVGRLPEGIGCSAQELTRVSAEMQVELAKLSTNSTHIKCDTCGHYIPLTNPELVIEAVQKRP